MMSSNRSISRRQFTTNEKIESLAILDQFVGPSSSLNHLLCDIHREAATIPPLRQFETFALGCGGARCCVISTLDYEANLCRKTHAINPVATTDT